MVNHFLPGLRCLRTDMEHLSPEHEVILSSMIKECEQKVENKTVQEPQGLSSMRENVVYPFQPMCLRYLKNAWCMISTQH